MAEFSGVVLSSSAVRHINRGKKLKINLNSWKCNVRKTQRNRRQTYISSRNKTVIALQRPKEGPVCKCKGNCYGNQISVERKLQLFHVFRNLSYNEQTRLLHSQCLVVDKPKRRVQEEAVSRRQYTVRFYLPLEEGKDPVRVYKKTISNVFSVTSRRLQILTEKVKSHLDISDHRGLHKNRPHAITDDIKNKFSDHINLFHRQESHYSRGKTNNEYPSPNHFSNVILKLFSNTHPDLNVSKRVYADVFNSEFKLKFGLPRSGLPI